MLDREQIVNWIESVAEADEAVSAAPTAELEAEPQDDLPSPG